MATELALQKAASAWRKPETEKIVMIPDLAEAFAGILDDIWNQAWLGNATTRELIEEIKARIEVGGDLDYRPVDELPDLLED